MFFQIHENDIKMLPESMVGGACLLPELLQKSRVDSTVKKYGHAFEKFRKWVICNGLGSSDALPAKAFMVATYLASLIQESNSASPVISAFYAIKWYHDINGLLSPTDSKLVVNVLESGKRILGKETIKKQPVTIEIISSVYKTLYEYGNIKSQRIICAILVGFSGFMRSAELLNIKVSDIVFNPTRFLLKAAKQTNIETVHGL